MRKLSILRFLALFWLVICGPIFAGPIDDAKVLFQRYTALEAAFDPTITDLYSDDAVISNTRTYPTGQVRVVTIPAPQYKALIRKVMPLARMKSDYSTYSETTFTLESNGIRIKAKRFSVLKKYESPISILVAPDKTGTWTIREELSESRPF